MLSTTPAVDAGTGRCATVHRMRIGLTALAALVVFAMAGCQAASGEVFQHSFNQPLMLGDRPVGQTFRPVTAEIAGVDVLLATYAQSVDPAGELAAVLRAGAGGRVLARTVLRHPDLGNDEWAAIRFVPPVAASEVLAVELTWDGASPLAVWANVPLEAPGEDDLLNDPYPGGELLRDGDAAVGDLAFRVVGSGGPGDAARNVMAVLRSGASRLADRPLFLVTWLLLLAGAGGFGVWGLRRAPSQLGDGRRGQQGREHEEARP